MDTEGSTWLGQRLVIPGDLKQEEEECGCAIALSSQIGRVLKWPCFIATHLLSGAHEVGSVKSIFVISDASTDVSYI